MNRALLWIEAARPKTLLLSLMPVLISTSIAVRENQFSYLTSLMTLLTALCLQVGANFANDYFDFIKGADTVHRKGPRRMTQAGLLSPSEMKLATFLTFSLTTLLGIYLTFKGGPLFTLLTTLSIASGILYTAGPKPIAYLGLGELFVFFFFGPIATVGATYLQTLSFSWEPFFLGCSLGLLASAVLVVNNLRDIEEDRRAHKKTLAVRFGPKFAQIEYTFFLLLGILIPTMMGYWPVSFILIPALIPLRSTWKRSQESNLNTTLAQTAQIGLLTALVTSLCLL